MASHGAWRKRFPRFTIFHHLFADRNMSRRAAPVDSATVHAATPYSSSTKKLTAGLEGSCPAYRPNCQRE
ncbi:hypothetical protein E4U21_006490 [Claviceps maximensis]|nr:hypothetical protein E4U21_006490 [Claviceps maximensis]